MSPIQIVMIVLGLGLIFASYIISEKMGHNKDTKEQIETILKEKKLTDQELRSIKSQIEVLVEEVVDSKVVSADDQMSQISNEKIMAVSEYSDQVLEKIDQNHNEVVFLYDMLNKKETELKDNVVSKNLDNSKDESKKVEEKEIKDTIIETQIKLPMDKEQIVEQMNDTSSKNNNDVILKLYEEGKSILEISKMLELGQGEVKLVVDLYRGVKS